MPQASTLCHIDPLSMVMLCLVLFVTICIASFSYRFLDGDTKKSSFFVNLTILTLSLGTMVSSNNIFLFLITWASSNCLLVILMMHKHEWKAARNAALLALKNFTLGFILISCGICILSYSSHQISIQGIISSSIDPKALLLGKSLLVLGAMTQSAIFPFYRWLLSSLNSPTPVSALMHAGLVNGGGFLLARFAPLFLKEPHFLTIIFTLGVITALIGSLFKLIQTDIKRMLASSTMGQMGFMFAQCGLGLFPAAVAHLCWHGLFKAYLFLSSGSAPKDKRFDLDKSLKAKHVLFSAFNGLLATYTFSLSSHTPLVTKTTLCFLVLLTFIMGTQFSLSILRNTFNYKWILSTTITTLLGGIYGLHLRFIEHILAPLGINSPQTLNPFYITGLMLLGLTWFIMLLYRSNPEKKKKTWLLKLYVNLLNKSQPHPKTITAHRNNYRY